MQPVLVSLALLALGGLPYLLWGTFVRVVFGLHATWLVNSATHKWGSRRFKTRDDSIRILVCSMYGESLYADRALRAGREEVTVSARVVNLGSGAARVPVSLIADGRTVQEIGVDLEPSGSAAATFSPLPLGQAPVRITARAEAPGLTVDNDRHAVLTPGEVLRVAFAGGGRSRPFVQQALGVGANPRFATSTASAALGDPDRHDVVVLEEGAPAAQGAAARLTSFVRQGGGLLVLLGGRGGGAWGTAWRNLLGGEPGGTVEPASAGGTVLAGVSYDHPVLEPFRAPRSGDFGSVHVYRYRRFDPDSSARLLARFDDGAAALVERRLGEGRVLVWTSAADNVWSDLPVQPVFLPLVHQMVRYLAGYTERRAALVVGQAIDLEAARRIAGGGSDFVLEAPGGARTPLGASASAVPVDQPGFYTLRALDADLAPQAVAVNVDPAEGDLTPLDVDAVQAAMAPLGAGGAAAAAGAAAQMSPVERERRQGLWWYLVIAAATLALGETFLSNRLPAIGRA